MWIILSFGVALFDSLKNVVSKFTLKDTNEYVVAWSNSFVSAILILPYIIFNLPSIKPNFFLGLFVSGTLNVAAMVFFMKSIKLSDLSKTVPLTAISPLLLLITSPIIVGEFPKFNGIVGMILIVIGAYLLNLNGLIKSSESDEKFFSKFLYPFQLLFKEKGSRYMLMVVLLWSITA
ncbi:MAG: EamA family transporter, partial [Ignavibacteria bacterium]|nr:EamA family transporter [Ignavibacteria bacterium]